MRQTFASISHVLLDIEGTTCPVSFVSQTLFPYARHHLETFLQEHFNDAQVRALVEEVEREWQLDTNPEAIRLRAGVLDEPVVSQELHERVVPYLNWLIQTDRKLTALKELQGLIWEEGYGRGLLTAPLYADVPASLRHWRSQGQTLAVYSSGSVKAQQLLYAYSSAGDLRALFSHWFDTRIGLKQQPASYERICQLMQVPTFAVLFISDSAGELEAAQQAGLPILQSQRGGELQGQRATCPGIQSFAEVSIQPAP
ncbi:MAG: acireductone synthase [Cyanobium sp.]